MFFTICATAQKIPLTSSSEEAIIYYNEGWELEDRLELDAAEILYKKAVVLDSTFALAHLRLAMVKDNYDDRKERLKEALKYIDKISDGEKLWILGSVDFYAEGYDGSKEYNYFKQLLALYPNDEVANYLFGYVNIHHGTHKPEIAIRHFKKAMDINPKYIKPVNYLAHAYLEARDYKNALVTTEGYMALLPNSVDPLDRFAEILMRSGAYQKSIDGYTEVLKIDNKYPWALMGIAANLNFLNRHSEARTYIERLDESILSDYEYRHKWKAQVVSYLDEGDTDKAIGVLEDQKQESISGKNSREPLFHIYYSFLRKTRIYFENGQAEKGLTEYKKWNEYVQENIKSEGTKTRIQHLSIYYEAYKLYLEDNTVLALEKLARFHKKNGETDASNILTARIFMKEKNYLQAIERLEQTDITSPYNQYWFMVALEGSGKLEAAKQWRAQIVDLNDRNNINLALVRKKAISALKDGSP